MTNQIISEALLLSTWIDEIEVSYKMEGFYRCYTDEVHGFYFDVYPDKAITFDGEILVDTENRLQGLICDLKFGED